MAVAYVNASTGAADAAGAWSATGMTPAQAGNIIILQVLQDGTTADAVTQTSATNITALDGTANTWTYIGNYPVGVSATGLQHLWIGRSTGTSAPTFTGGNSTSEDVFFRMYEFSGVEANSTAVNTTIQSLGSSANTGTICADKDVTTTYPGGMALNFVALSDDSMGLGVFTGMTGGTWSLTPDVYSDSAGTDGTIALMRAEMPSAGTIGGGSDNITSIGWGVTGLALIPELSPTVNLDTPNSPADGATGVSTTPELNFIGTDANSDTIEYNVQVDIGNGFDSSMTGTSFTLKYVDIYLEKQGSPTDNLLLDIRSTSFSGSSLGQSNAVAASTLPASVDLVRFTFATPITINSGTQYYMTLARSGSSSTSNDAMVYGAINPYSGGNAGHQQNGSWSNDTNNFDWGFIIYDNNTVAIISQNSHTDLVDHVYGATTAYMSEVAGQSFTGVNVAGPSLNKLSVTPDATFTDVTDGTDTHPFASGDQIKYVPSSGGSFYFNDSSPTDPDGYWTDDAKAFDSDATPSTYAYAGATVGSESTGYLKGVGTNASGSGTITGVQARIYASDMYPGSNDLACKIYQADNTVLGDFGNLNLPDTAAWTSYINLSTPAGGWTWSILQNLYTKLWKAAGSDASALNVYKVEISVNAPYSLSPSTKYYWRVRAIDPGGSNTYGAWSDTHSFTTASGAPAVDHRAELFAFFRM